MSSLLHPWFECQIQDLASPEGPKLISASREFPWFTGAQVTIKLGAIASVSASIEAPFEEGLKLLDSTLFSVGNVLSVRFGYDGDESQVSPWYYSVLSQGGVGLSISAEGLTGTIQGLAGKSWVNFKFVPPASIRDGLSLARHIVQRLGFAYEATPKAEEKLRALRLNEGNERYFSGVRTYLEVLSFLMQRVSGSFYFTSGRNGEGPMISLIESSDMKGRAPSKAFVMKGEINFRDSKFPIVSLSPELNPSLFISKQNPAARASKAIWIDGETGEIREARVKSSDLESPVGQEYNASPEPQDISSGSVVTDRKLEEGEETGHLIVDGESQSTIENRLKAHVENEREGWVASMALQTIGLPSISPGETVVVSGVGKRLSGTYYVKQVAHAYAIGDYSTTLTLQSDGEPFDSHRETVNRNTQPQVTE